MLDIAADFFMPNCTAEDVRGLPGSKARQGMGVTSQALRLMDQYEGHNSSSSIPTLKSVSWSPGSKAGQGVGARVGAIPA